MHYITQGFFAFSQACTETIQFFLHKIGRLAIGSENNWCRTDNFRAEDIAERSWIKILVTDSVNTWMCWRFASINDNCFPNQPPMKVVETRHAKMVNYVCIIHIWCFHACGWHSAIFVRVTLLWCFRRLLHPLSSPYGTILVYWKREIWLMTFKKVLRESIRSSTQQSQDLKIW